MNDFTFLTEEQCFDSSRKLEILEKRGTIAPITDFSILLGGYVSDDYYYNNGNSLEDRSGWYWTSSDDKDNDVRVVRFDGSRIHSYVNRRGGGARPALPYSSIRNISSNGVRGRDGILEVEYGEYPQKVASKRLQDELERAYNYNQSSIRKTGKTYTTDSRKYDEYDEKFSAQIIEEYSFDDGKKYVRVKANSYYAGSEFKLSNGERYKDGDYVWVEVQPIKWLIDEKSDIALSERLLFAGVQFKHVQGEVEGLQQPQNHAHQQDEGTRLDEKALYLLPHMGGDVFHRGQAVGGQLQYEGSGFSGKEGVLEEEIGRASCRERV